MQQLKHSKKYGKMNMHSEEEVVKELLKNGIEHYIESFDKGEKEYKKITEIMESKGYKGKIWDMV